MAVLLPDRRLAVRRRVIGVGAHGDVTATGWGAAGAAWPGRAEERPDLPPEQSGSRSWVLALDSRAWPVERGDVVVDAAGGLEWLVLSADLRRNNADPAIDYVRVEAHLRSGGSTRP